MYLFPEANDNEKCIERISSFYDHIEKAEKPVVSIGGIIQLLEVFYKA
ncbi:MAG: hypothetical protein Ct9H300mP5_5460 [Candidatus Pelagibacterales bacterium]|nr:MAG: hypothetical protein Ct9H300mP5_5460 [Pelagibacterales bacterium]